MTYDDKFSETLLVILNSLIASVESKRSANDARREIQKIIPNKIGRNLHVLAQTEVFDGSTHFAAVFRANGGTITMSYAPRTELPWPLRGAQRWKDQDLLTVNGRTLSVQQGIAITEICDRRDILRGIVHTCLYAEEIERRSIAVDAFELQSAIDDWRRARGLNSASDTRSWLDERGMSFRRLAEQIEAQVRIRKLHDLILMERGASEEEDGVYDHSALILENLDPLSIQETSEYLRQLSCSLEEFVNCECLRGVRMTFSLLSEASARFRSLKVAEQCQSGDLHGPYAQGDGSYTLVKVLGTTGPSTKRRSNQLIQDWLAEREAAARVEWNWGSSG